MDPQFRVIREVILKSGETSIYPTQTIRIYYTTNSSPLKNPNLHHYWPPENSSFGFHKPNSTFGISSMQSHENIHLTRKTNMVPILRSGSNLHDSASCRPVSLTSVIRKIFEKIIMNKRLMPYLESTSYITSCQCGYRGDRNKILAIRDSSSHQSKMPPPQITTLYHLLLLWFQVCWCVICGLSPRLTSWANPPISCLSLIHIWRCRRSTLCRSRWSPYH